MNEFRKTNDFTAESYQTGNTHPPKSYGGVIALLLILVIFLSGIVSMLSLMNIRLFRMVESQNTQDISPLARCAPAQPEISVAQYGIAQSSLGITLQEITSFFQYYYDVPQGVCVTQVEPSSDCYAQGLRSGDVLTHCNDTSITCQEDLETLLMEAMPGEQFTLSYYRNGEQHQLTITLD